MSGSWTTGKAVLASSLAVALVGGFSVPASAHNNPPPVMHSSSQPHHAHNAAVGSGWHGYHHGYGFYGFWPWYFPWTYGYGLPYYGTTFFVDAPVTYVQMAPEESGAVQPANSWYYCHNPEGYFPYVKTCALGWQTVPIQPQAAPAAPAAPPAPPPANQPPPS